MPESGCVVKNGAIVPWSPAAMPATCVPCSSSPPRFANGSVDCGVGHARRHERPRDDHLRRRECRVPLRVARRVLVAGGVEERVRLVDALVDDPDLHPLARVGPRRPPDDGRADQLRRAIEARAVGRARPDARDAGYAGEPCHRSARHDDGEAVQRDAVAPVDVRARDRLGDAARDVRLLAIELLEVADRGRRRELQPPAARRERGERPVAHGGIRERGRAERDDDLDRRGRARQCRRCGDRMPRARRCRR